MTLQDGRAWLMQKSAPLTVRYGRPLQIAGHDLPEPRSLVVPTRHGPVRCELYRPPGNEVVPVYVHLHGGAFIVRHPRMDDFFARFLVARAGLCLLAIGGFSAGGNLAASACLQARESGRFQARFQRASHPPW